jgi:hypothetical protein
MNSSGRLLAIAANASSMGFVYMVEEELFDWGISVKDCQSPEEALERVLLWIKFYKPAVVLAEELAGKSRKGEHTHILIAQIEAAAESAQVPCLRLPRHYAEPNKYAEAARLAQQYPQIAPWLPAPRKIWEKEPRHIILFEALSLADGWYKQERREGPLA